MIEISAFMPVQKKLSEKYPDVWVRIVPPTWATDGLRDDFIARAIESGNNTGLGLVNYELWLTFGGTNMSVATYAADENGKPEWEEVDGTWKPKIEAVTFPEGITEEEFYKRLGRLPMPIIDAWYARVMEVVTPWGDRFRSQGASTSDS